MHALPCGERRRLLPVAITALLVACAGAVHAQTAAVAPEPQTSVDVATVQDPQWVVDEAYALFKDDTSGANANYIKILDTVPERTVRRGDRHR